MGLEKALRFACSGVKSGVAKEQAATGIKDAYTQFWVERLLARAKELKTQHKTPNEIHDELLQWVDEKMDTIRNEIFTMKGIGSDLVSATSINTLARV